MVTIWGGFSTQWYGRALANAPLMESAWLSLRLALIAAAGATVVGTALALALTRFGPFRGGARSPSSASRAAGGAGDRDPAVAAAAVHRDGVSTADSETVAIAHVTFTSAFAAVVLQSRLISVRRSLEEARWIWAPLR